MINYDRIYVEIKCIEQKYPAKPCTISNVNIDKSKVCWLKAIVVLRNTM